MSLNISNGLTRINFDIFNPSNTYSPPTIRHEQQKQYSLLIIKKQLKMNYTTGFLVEAIGFIIKYNDDPYASYWCCKYLAYNEVLLIEINTKIEKVTGLYLIACPIANKCDAAERLKPMSFVKERTAIPTWWSLTKLPLFSPTISPIVNYEPTPVPLEQTRHQLYTPSFLSSVLLSSQQVLQPLLLHHKVQHFLPPTHCQHGLL